MIFGIVRIFLDYKSLILFFQVFGLQNHKSLALLSVIFTKNCSLQPFGHNGIVVRIVANHIEN
jgi:hypothetical protein